MSPIRLLLADPDHAFQSAISPLLMKAGYHVALVDSRDELAARLRDNWFHFVILNVNLINPNDSLDFSGLDFLNDQDITKISPLLADNVKALNRNE